ncbi:phosphatidylserine decarboxylase-domain-containing protein [Aspergillus germanicus]
MGIIGVLHAAVDYLLSWVKIIQNREIGWLTINRKTGQYMREQQPLLKKIKLLLLFNPLTTWLDTTHAMRLYMHNSAIKEGKKEASPASRNRIQQFVNTFHINMNDFEPSDINAYPTFEDFFIRHHKPGSRPIHEPNDNSSAVVVADSRVVVYEAVAESKKIWIKGEDFSITNLVMDKKIGPQFHDGPVASFRLSPQDYHRYHSPVSGRVKVYRSMPGDYYDVDPLAIRSGVDILTRNARDYVVIETEEFGDVLFVAIGASQVGTVEINEKWQKPGAEIKKGDELGIFQFGGSSIIVAFQKGRIQFDEDLIGPSKKAIAVDVEVGMSLGRAVPEGNEKGPDNS